jgi:alcohol dehydrogenase YqhD (iron-dependent ADH family)
MSEIIGSTLTTLSHGQALALVYPDFVEYSWHSQPEKYAFVSRILNPLLILESDEISAKACAPLLRNFLDSVGLRINLEAVGLTKSKKNEILECPIWKHLPMAPTKDILTIVSSILNKEPL